MLTRRSESLNEILGKNKDSFSPETSKDLFTSSITSGPKMHEVFYKVPEDGLPLPHVIFPFSSDTEDFFATVATFYQDKTPISALVHVLGKETSILAKQESKNDLPIEINTSYFRQAMIGACIGEATIAGTGSNDVMNVSYAACRRTLSFAVCRASIIHQFKISADLVTSRWIKLRKLTGLGVSFPATEVVSIIHGLFSNDLDEQIDTQKVDVVLLDCIKRQVGPKARLQNLLLPYLLDFYPATREFLPALKGPFDSRMTAFTRIVTSIQHSSRGLRNDEIAVAFFLNEILPGSFSHTGVLSKLIEFFPAALVWYGFFAAISNSGDSQKVNPSLIAKLDRDLLAPFSLENRPQSDIAFEELEVLARTSLRSEVIHPSQQRSFLVSLVPGVDVHTRLGSDVDSQNDRFRRELETEEVYSKVTRLLEEALLSIKKVSPSTKPVPPPNPPPKKRSKKEK